jgi:hypothetical protein
VRVRVVCWLVIVAGLAAVESAPAAPRPKDRPKPVDPEGRWAVTRTWAGDAAEARVEFVLTLERDGDRLIGRSERPGSDEVVSAVSVQGDRVTFTVRPKGGGGIGFSFSGQLDGDTIRGQLAAALAIGTWEARRLKPGDRP